MNLFLTTANKGGTLKTTFTALLADWAAHHGRHAVLVDAEDSALQESAASIARTSRIPAFRFPLDSVLPDSLDPGAWKGAPMQQAVPVFPRDATRLPALSFTRANLGDRDKAWAHLLNNLAYLGFDNDMDFFVDTGASQLDTLINKLPLLEMAKRKGLNIVIVFMICTNDDSAAAAISYLNAFGQLGLHLRTIFVLTSDHNDGREEYSFTREKCIGTALEKYPGLMSTAFLGMLPRLVHDLVFNKRILPGRLLDNTGTPFGTRMELELFAAGTFDRIARSVLTPTRTGAVA